MWLSLSPIFLQSSELQKKNRKMSQKKEEEEMETEEKGKDGKE